MKGNIQVLCISYCFCSLLMTTLIVNHPSIWPPSPFLPADPFVLMPMIRFFVPMLICTTQLWSRSCERLDIFHLFWFWCLDTPRPWTNDDSCVFEASKIFKASLCNLLSLWSGPLYWFYFGLHNFVYAKSIARFRSGHHYHSFLLIHLLLCLWCNRSYPFMIYNIRQWSRSCERLDIFHLF